MFSSCARIQPPDLWYSVLRAESQTHELRWNWSWESRKVIQLPCKSTCVISDIDCKNRFREERFSVMVKTAGQERGVRMECSKLWALLRKWRIEVLDMGCEYWGCVTGAKYPVLWVLIVPATSGHLELLLCHRTIEHDGAKRSDEKYKTRNWPHREQRHCW